MLGPHDLSISKKQCGVAKRTRPGLICTVRAGHCRCSVFDIPGPKNGPILGTRFRTQNGSVFWPPLIVFLSRCRKTDPFWVRNLALKMGLFFGPGMSKTAHRQCHARTVQISPGRVLLATPHCFSDIERSGGLSKPATRRQGQEVASVLLVFWRKRLASHVGIYAQHLVRPVCSCLRCFRQPRWLYDSRRAQATQRHSR